MRKVLKAIGWILLIGFIVLQFFRPAKNVQAGVSAHHISTKFAIPSDVTTILEKACTDCHSNNTRYPWYYNIQPIGIWMNNHVIEGKNGLNFSEYTNRRLRYQYHKMEEVVELVNEEGMPLDSYTWTHKDARLTTDERAKLVKWAESIMDTLETQYPIDSLKRPTTTPAPPR